MKKVIRSITEYPIVGIFFAVCICTLAGYLLRTQDDFSSMENRYLQKRPAVTVQGLADGSYMETFETYTNEQIPLRGFLVKCKAFFVWMTGSSENDGIAKGDDGYLFDKVNAYDKVQKNISAMENFVKTIDRDVYIAIAPTSTWINEEKLPAGMPVLDESSCQKMLDGKLGLMENAHIIDLYGALSAHKEEQLYYRTDHHWTTRGAGYAYKETASAMGLDAKDISRYERHEVRDFYGTHYAKYKGILVEPDTIEYYDVPVKELVLSDRTVYDLMDKEKLEGYDKYAAFMYGNDGIYTIDTGNGEGKRLYILKDSYANCLIPYLVMNYDKITVIDLRYFGESVPDELSKDPDADILLLYNWTFVNDDNHFYKMVGR